MRLRSLVVRIHLAGNARYVRYQDAEAEAEAGAKPPHHTGQDGSAPFIDYAALWPFKHASSLSER